MSQAVALPSGMNSHHVGHPPLHVNVDVSTTSPVSTPAAGVATPNCPGNMRRPRVQFSTVPVFLPPSMYSVEKCERWYQLSDLEDFRSHARDQGRQLRTPATDRNCHLADSESTRGFEQRSCMERQRRKYISNRFVVKSSKNMDPEKLAKMSQRITAWAADLARKEALRDYERAYNNENGKRSREEEEASDEDHKCAPIPPAARRRLD